MNTSVSVPNIIASYDIDKINFHLSKGNNFDKVSNLLNDDKIFNFSTKKGNLIKFSHSFNFESEGNKKGALINLEIIDPTNEFESTFLTYTLDRISGVVSKEELFNKVNDILKSKPKPDNTKLNPKDEKFQSFFNVSDRLDGFLIGDKIKVFDKEEFEFAELEAEIANQQYKKDLKAWQEKVQVATNNLLSLTYGKPTLWFMYGISNNLADWAGPIGTQLAAAQYFYDGEGGARRIILTFTTLSFSYSKLAKKTLNLSEYTEGEAIIQSPFAIDNGIRQCILSYLDKVLPLSKNNIIFAIPRPEIVFAPTINSLQKEVVNTLNTFTLKPNIADAQLRARLIAYATSKTFDSKINAKFAKLVSRDKKTGTSDIIRFISDKIVINKLFFELGFKVAEFEDLETEQSADKIPITDNYLSIILSYTPAWAANLGAGLVDTVKDFLVEKPKLELLDGKDYLDYTLNILQKEDGLNYYGIFNKIKLVCDEEFLDYLSPLDKFINKFKEITGIQLIYFYESNYKILNLWKQLGIIENPNEPVFILSTDEIKNHYLYGNVDLDNKSNTQTSFNTYPEIVQKFGNPNYKKWIKEAIDTKHPVDQYQFGKLLDLPDEFAYDNTLKTIIEKNKLPVFRSGYKDSNILSFNFGINEIYSMQLLNYREDTQDIFTAVQALKNEKIIKSEEFNLFSEDLESIIEKLNHLFNTSVTTEQLINQIKGNNRLKPTNIKEAISLFIDVAANSKGKKVISLDEKNQLAPIYLKTAIGDRLAELSMIGNMETLPFFHLSNNYTITLPVILLIRENQILGPTPDKFLADSPFTGLWNIYGFKHEISESNISSSFTLVKNNQTTVLGANTKQNISFNQKMEEVNGN